MKGGVTSGVVYPAAIHELSKRYSFRGIGGTSAGAIAAAATAAAELGRRKGRHESFEQLGKVAADLQGGRLLGLFRPEPEAAALFRIFVASLQPQGKFLAVGTAIARGFAGYFLAAIAAGAFVGFCLPVSNLAAALVALLVAFLAAIPLVALGIYRSVLGGLSDKGFGACSGYDRNGAPALVNWLHNLLQRLANVTTPLTFGDLHRAPPFPDEDFSGGCVIDLRLVTSNLAHGRPYVLPHLGRNTYFDPDEWASLFPPDVIEHLKEKSRKLDIRVQTKTGKPLMALPDGPDLPVVVGARMSLSFPILLRAVPLYAVDFTLREMRNAEQNGGPLVAERSWYSDGGLCTNLPIHFFDAPIPRWPTFAINLKDAHPDHTSEDELVWMPSNNNQGRHEFWNRFDDRSGANRLFGFVAALVSTAKDWRDNTLTKMPGYRDRVVHVSLKTGEGGVNLGMGDEMIGQLNSRGRRAGERLLTFNFDNHQWVRYRVLMGGLSTYLKAFARVMSAPRSQNIDIFNIVTGRSTQEPPAYPFSAGQRAFAIDETDQLLSLSNRWLLAKENFEVGTPKPEPELRLTTQAHPSCRHAESA